MGWHQFTGKYDCDYISFRGSVAYIGTPAIRRYNLKRFDRVMLSTETDGVIGVIIRIGFTFIRVADTPNIDNTYKLCRYKDGGGMSFSVWAFNKIYKLSGIYPLKLQHQFDNKKQGIAEVMLYCNTYNKNDIIWG